MVRSGAKPGERVWISIDTARMQLFDVNSQVRLPKAGE
ncbi:hypothetical protein BN1221_00043c [Brenneria goodwinii]|uniref:Uncharacterized protein n=1 Tax=Brenneria goodwinii TaxID=1109412 RepID=A0A0G4JP04_9GAMM|nr:hypothetical protein BN1221_00043c [Brenneria goodwinii]